MRSRKRILKKRSIIPIVLPEQFRKKYFNGPDGNQTSQHDVNSFYLTKIESSCQSLQLPSLPYRSAVHECVLLTSGSMVRTSGLETYSIKSNSVFVVPAGQITSIESIGRNAKGYYCHFDTGMLITKFTTLDLIQEFDFLRVLTKPLLALPEKAMPHLVHLFERIFEEQQTKGMASLIQSYLLTILFEIKKHYSSTNHTAISPVQNLTDKFKFLVATHFKSLKTVAEYAQLLCVTPNHLNKSVKSTSGKSPSLWIDESLILEAKVLLYQSTLSVSEVSYELGIDDPSYFGRLFKKYTNTTPTGFRKKLQSTVH